GSDQPSTSLLPDLETDFEIGEEHGDWEGIADMPDPLTPGAHVRLMLDQGYDVLYQDGRRSNKDESSPYVSKGRTDVFTLTGAVGTVANLTGTGTFPAQAANTTGAPQTFTVTNGGSDAVEIGKVHVTGASGSDFLISQDNCGDTTLPALAVGD